MEQECLFCKMARKQVPVTLAYEDDGVFAFLDINPIAKGHALVILKRHYETLLEVAQGDLKGLMEAIQKIAVAVVKVTGAEGFNIMQNNGEVAGQLIRHVHFHIIPRFKDDNIPVGNIAMPRGKYEGRELQEMTERVKREIPEAKKEEKVEEEVEKEKPIKHSKREAYLIRRQLEIG